MATAEEQAQRAAEGDLSSRLLERLVSQVGGHARVQAIFGDPVERAGITVIPIGRVRWGVGGGGGAAPEGSGSGGGGGVDADPIGYIEITSAGASFRPIPRSFGPGAFLAAAIAVAIVLQALARFRR
jgi:uncharacterized spore protein YtfJ